MGSTPSRTRSEAIRPFRNPKDLVSRPYDNQVARERACFCLTHATSSGCGAPPM